MSYMTLNERSMENPRKIGEVSLDFGRDILYGFQLYYDPLVVKAMKIGRDFGKDLPRVKVVRFEEGHYQLYVDHTDGGHHRARLGFEDGGLEADLWDRHLESSDQYNSYDVRSMIPITPSMRVPDTDAGQGWYVRLVNALRHLPRDFAWRFCEENNLDPRQIGVHYWDKTVGETLAEKCRLREQSSD